MARGKRLVVIGVFGVGLILGGALAARRMGAGPLIRARGRRSGSEWVVSDAEGHRLYGWRVDGPSLEVEGPRGGRLGRVVQRKGGLLTLGPSGAVTGCIVNRKGALTVRNARDQVLVSASTPWDTYVLHGPDGEYLGRVMGHHLWRGRTALAARRTAPGTWAVTDAGKPWRHVHGPALSPEVVILGFDGLPPILRLALLDARGGIPGTPARAQLATTPKMPYVATLTPFEAGSEDGGSAPAHEGCGALDR